MATRCNIMENENGVELREIILNSTGKTLCYEIYMDGDYINRLTSKREARQLWKAFAGI